MRASRTWSACCASTRAGARLSCRAPITASRRVGATVVNLTPNNIGNGVRRQPAGPERSRRLRHRDRQWLGRAGRREDQPADDRGGRLRSTSRRLTRRAILPTPNSGFPTSYTGQAYLQGGGTTTATYDAVVGPTGRMTLTPAYSAMVSYEHYWTPTIRQGLFAGAVDVRYSGAIRTAAGFAAARRARPASARSPSRNGSVYNPFSTQYNGGAQYNIGSNLIWSPVKNLDIGVEAFYFRNELQHRQFDVNTGTGRLISADDNWRFRCASCAISDALAAHAEHLGLRAHLPRSGPLRRKRASRRESPSGRNPPSPPGMKASIAASAWSRKKSASISNSWRAPSMTMASNPSSAARRSAPSLAW